MMTGQERAQGQMYRDVDREQQERQQVLAWFLDFQNSWSAIQQGKQAMLSYLQPRNGYIALDAGCGLGDDTRILADHVGPEGKVIGIDASEAMITLARQRSADGASAVEFNVADINALDFDDASFDVVRCERTFQWLEDPERALRELVRVTTPGGRIAVFDADWASAIWDWGDPAFSTRLLDAHRGNMPNAEAGRQLPGLFRRAGLVDIQVKTYLQLLDSPMIDEMRRNGLDLLTQPVLGADEWARFDTARDAAIQSGTAYATAILFAVGGTKPEPGVSPLDGSNA